MVEKKYFDGLLNGDDAEEFVKENEYTNAINLRFGSTDDGKTGWFENVKGNVLITNSLPSGTNTCIGSCVDEDEEAIIWFNSNKTPGSYDGIYIYFNSTNTIKTVLLGNQVEGGLGFSTQIQARVIGDQLFWADGVNEFRRINYKAAIKMNDAAYPYKYAYSFSPNLISPSVITVIRTPPKYALQVNKDTSGQVANFIKDGAFKFSYFYTYKDGEQSVLAPWSMLMDYNFDSETALGKDSIFVYVPNSEFIQQDVQKISIVVRREESKKCFVFKEFNRSNSNDNDSINSHNAKTTRLNTTFYNNENGVALDDAYSVKPFDSVPLAPKTYEAARDRNFVGNYIKGYETPVTTSLTAAVSAPVSGTELTGEWYKVEITGYYTVNTRYLIRIFGLTPSGYYQDTTVTGPPFPASPASVSFSNLIFAGETLDDIGQYYGYPLQPDPFNPVAPYISSLERLSVYSPVTGAVPSGPVGKAVMKSDASYQLGVVFFDSARRKCGVVTKDNLRIQTPDRTLAAVNDRRGIDWSLSNTNRLEEIPAWATHYAVVSTENLRTRFFLQLLSDSVFYVDKKSDGTYDFGTKNDTYLNTRAGIAVDIKNLTSFKLGYTFSEGDICKIYTPSGIFSLAIIAQEGNYIVCQNTYAYTLNISNAKFEIYTPRKKDTYEFFYEQKEIYSINNAGTSSRSYSVLTGQITGDVWVLQRGSGVTNYTVEAMSPNDKFYANWYTDAGMGTYVSDAGQLVKSNYISYSNKYLPNTSTNGLCTFDALDESNVPAECGEINKLQLTSKTKEDGTVLLAICHYECASIYLGESQLVSQYGNSFIAKSDGVIGTINVLKGSFGTQHPESVALYRGMVMWWDAFNGVVVQYASNGLFPVSSYKMNTFFKQLGKKYLNSPTSYNFFAGFDPIHEEYLLSSSFTGGTPSTNFPTTSASNKLRVFDGMAATYGYKLGADKWVSKYNFIPENFVYLGTKLFTFKNGQLYVHGEGAYNNFYGTQYDSVISFPSNAEPIRTKVYFNLSVEANRAPDNTYIYCSRPEEQVTTLLAADFEEKEGIYYAPIYRDRLSPNVYGDYNKKMTAGDWMRSTAMNFQLHFEGSSKLELKFININYRPSLGQKTQ